MKSLTRQTNFARVFHRPDFSKTFCLKCGQKFNLELVDWFKVVDENEFMMDVTGGIDLNSDEQLKQYLRDKILNTVTTRMYYGQLESYLVITDYEDTFIISEGEIQ